MTDETGPHHGGTDPPERSDRQRITLFLLHGLAGSARTWDPFVAALNQQQHGAYAYRCVALDLPGHGRANRSDQLTVEQMATWLTGVLVASRPTVWALVGHSMGGKVATLVTERADHGIPGLSRPHALVLVAPSPLEPEPMDESRREQMTGWAADGPISAQDARTYVDANIAGPLPDDRLGTAIDDVRRVDPTAWSTWLQRGSREDWSRSAGPVRVPTLIVAGAEDSDLGADLQRRLTLPRVAARDVTVVGGAAHLVPLEQPARLAELVADHVGNRVAARAALPHDLDALIASDRVSSRTRAALLDRLDESLLPPGVFDDDQRRLLTALLARVLPQRGTTLDLTARIESRLRSGDGDGWRFADLPDDAEAWRQGLDTLAVAAADLEEQDPADQDEVVARLMAGELGSDDPGHLSKERMRLWGEDVRAEAVRAWLSHPLAQAEIGYDGFANGGDGYRLDGYLRTGEGTREAWQRPTPRAEV